MSKILTICLLALAFTSNQLLIAKDCVQSLSDMKTSPGQISSQAAFKSCLSEYVQIQTLTVPAKEYLAKPFFEKIFKTFKIPYQTFQTPDVKSPKGQRFNVIATIPTDKSSRYDWSLKTKIPSIVLLNHIDVIDVKPKKWERPELAFSGKIIKDQNDHALWGRGSLDMKGIAIMQLISMMELFFSKDRPSHDIHFLAVGGEESNGSGAKGVIDMIRPKAQFASLLNAKFLLNEGGGGVYIPKFYSNLYAIDAEQKGGAWLEIENENQGDLLTSLSLWHFLKLKKFETKSEHHLCVVSDFLTPKPKANVNPSNFHVSIFCPQTNRVEMVTSFWAIMKKHYPEIDISITNDKQKILFKFSSQSSSHGSLKIGQGLIEKVLSVFYSLNMLQTKRLSKAQQTTPPHYLDRQYTPATKSLIKNISSKSTPLAILNSLSSLGGVREFMLKTVSNSLKVGNAFGTSCNLTNLSTNSSKKNIAYVDCRLVHTYNEKQGSNHAQVFVKELKEHIPYIKSSISILNGWNYSRSPSDNPYLIKMEEVIQKQDLQDIVSPFMNIAGSDSTWFRNPHLAGNNEMPPIPSYGFIPLIYSQKIIKTIHGSDERFPVDQIPFAIKTYSKIIRKLAL